MHTNKSDGRYEQTRILAKEANSQGSVIPCCFVKQSFLFWLAAHLPLVSPIIPGGLARALNLSTLPWKAVGEKQVALQTRTSKKPHSMHVWPCEGGDAPNRVRNGVASRMAGFFRGCAKADTGNHALRTPLTAAALLPASANAAVKPQSRPPHCAAMATGCAPIRPAKCGWSRWSS